MYCSTVCRRAVEFEIRRANRHLESAERRLSAARDRVAQIEAGAHGLGTLANAVEHVEQAEARVVELEGRLEALIGESS